MASVKGPQSSPGGQEPEIQKLNLAEITTRRRHMLGEELVIEWNSYTAESSALGATLIKDVSVESGEIEKPQTFNTVVVKNLPGDVVLMASNEADESSISARWVSETKVRLYLERLLKARPLKIPRGYRAHITVSRYVTSEGVGLRLHFSQVRLAEIGQGVVVKPTSGEEKASSSDGGKKAESTETEQGEKAGD